MDVCKFAMSKVSGLIAVVSMMFIVGAAFLPLATASSILPGGEVFYYQVSGGVCTSTTFSQTASDGQPNGELANNVGGPPETALVLLGAQICIKVSLQAGVGAASTPYTVSSSGLTGSFTFTTLADGSGSGEGVFVGATVGSA